MNTDNMILTNEDSLLAGLEFVLKKNDIDRSIYSLHGYGEDKVCLEKENDAWIVYIGERGLKHDLKRFQSSNSLESLLYACYSLIDEVSETDEEKSRLLYDLNLYSKDSMLLFNPYHSRFNKHEIIDGNIADTHVDVAISRPPAANVYVNHTPNPAADLNHTSSYKRVHDWPLLTSNNERNIENFQVSYKRSIIPQSILIVAAIVLVISIVIFVFIPSINPIKNIMQNISKKIIENMTNLFGG